MWPQSDQMRVGSRLRPVAALDRQREEGLHTHYDTPVLESGAWFELNFRYRETLYRIDVHRSLTDIPGSGTSLNGAACPRLAFTQVDDRREHVVIVRPQQEGA